MSLRRHKQTALAAMLLFPISVHAAPAQDGLRKSISRAIDQIKEQNQPARDSAAREIRNILKQDPTAANDLGESYWRKRFEAVKLGTNSSEIRKVIGSTAGPESDSGPCSGQSCTITLRLDDYWNAILFTSSQTHGLLGVSGFSRAARSVWVEPPKDFSGKWITYFVNGLPSHEIQYSNGHYVLFRAFHDNGFLSYEQHYPNGQIDGPETGRYPDGSKAYEGRYVEGKRAGSWIHWYSSGQKQLEQLYTKGQLSRSTSWHPNGQRQYEFKYDENGRETGQAAWNADGTLQFAHGSLSSLSGPKK